MNTEHELHELDPVKELEMQSFAFDNDDMSVKKDGYRTPI